jgi:hypothetical protein
MTDRNPELTIGYQILADYEVYNVYEYSSSSDFMYGEEKMKMATIGTSITYGAHTYEQYYYSSDKQTYPYLVAKGLLKLYGIECEIKNWSIDQGGINQLSSFVLDNIINERCDFVFIELGMNDHLGENPNIVAFENAINNAVTTLKENDITVILVGFFQQNPDWDLEYPANTVLYNNVLRNIALEHKIFFADIYAEFSEISSEKMYKDYMGDFMHHPTSFGHQLYYTCIMPFFIHGKYTDSLLFELIQ